MKNLKIVKILYFLMCILLYCLLVGLTTYKFLSNKDKNNKLDTVFTFPSKTTKNNEKFIAFYPEAGLFIDLNVILKSNLISNADKEKLKQNIEDLKKNELPYVDFCIKLVVKDGKDYVHIDHYNKRSLIENNINHEFWFESNLNYNFIDVLNDFNTNYSIDYEDLKELYFDFSIENDIYFVYFYLKNDGKMYIINLGD